MGSLDTADPLDPDVIGWWKKKADEIYSYIPDFGGFVVKANSEGMPGPQTYGRTHAEGANLLARALKPHGGVVMWRTFVYVDSVDPDRAKRPYKEFVPLDDRFEDNVILQVKNGPLDFQPREPVLPLFGALRHTPVMPELQIAQEYLGHSVYLVYLLPLWKEFFEFDTHCEGPGSTVAKLVTGKLRPYRHRAIAGVANTGTDTNWTGHHFAQANWHAFGRLAWNPETESDRIVGEWIRMTWNCDDRTARVIRGMMEPSWESHAASTSPYGLGMTCIGRMRGTQAGHYGPEFEKRANNDYDNWWVNAEGIGKDRTTAGTDFVSQYAPPNRDRFNDLSTCPEGVLLYFHFVPWNHVMPSGKTLKNELFEGLRRDLELVGRHIGQWESIRTKVDRLRYEDVMMRLRIQQFDAQTYYDAAYNFFSKYAVPDR